MILEVSLSVLSPDLWGLYVGTKSVEGQLNASSFIIKVLFLMVQFTVYTIADED